MEIKSLRYFLAVAREENMTKAADMLHVTQPTLSKTLKSLEDELGKKYILKALSVCPITVPCLQRKGLGYC